MSWLPHGVNAIEASCFSISSGIFSAKELRKFQKNSFRTDIFKQSAIFLNRKGGFFFNFKTEYGSKPKGAHYPKGIFAKALIRISDCADNSVLKVRNSAEKIGYSCFLAESKSIYGKIAPGKIFRKGTGEQNFFWVAVVGIVFVYPESGYFKGFAFHEHRYGSVFYSGFDNVLIFKNRLCFFRQSGGCYIKIRRFLAQKKISYAAADGKSFEPGFFEHKNCFFCGF